MFFPTGTLDFLQRVMRLNRELSKCDNASEA